MCACFLIPRCLTYIEFLLDCLTCHHPPPVLPLPHLPPHGGGGIVCPHFPCCISTARYPSSCFPAPFNSHFFIFPFPHTPSLLHHHLHHHSLSLSLSLFLSLSLCLCDVPSSRPCLARSLCVSPDLKERLESRFVLRDNFVR